ncbi:trypsin-like peptidase domain-containing protein [Frateuria sp. YIM B11624]|uniref:S1 family peptidase n=1 Tax=Frateuria sp. YIM B11624 TaxID=3143185 RepID=UPI003C73D8BA
MQSLRGRLGRIGREAAAWAWMLILPIICAVHAVPGHAATLDPSLLPGIQAATFEVVQAKPTSDPLTYEKPLPLNLLPFQERNDKYYSIGTAFAIGNNRYVTAGHVLLAGMDSLWGPPQLRDAAGHVYAIDKIVKFSMGKDFVVFTLAGKTGGDVLATNARPELNHIVYAVGNALGTGVVIRDGLYTSDTPEEQDGSWKWMRFSAPASPGNSGGPLLDEHGKVIGVVLAKSPNENLNYGLPIGEVLDAPDNRAVVDRNTVYQLDIFDALQNGHWKTDFALPLGLDEFYRTLQSRSDANGAEQLKALLAREAPNLFPAGKGSTRLLVEQTRLYAFPTLIVRDDNGQWQREGRAAKRFSLDANGFVDLGQVGHTMLLHVSRPDNMDAALFYSNAKARMDLLASAGLFQRAVAGEKITITSLGKPATESSYTDRWERPWLVDTWPFPYLNGVVVAYTLPVPDGCVMMMRMAPAAQENGNRLDMDQLANFIYATYQGTLAQWKDYLKAPAALPAAFHNIHLDADYGKRFAYRSQRVAFSYSSAVQPVEPENLLNLGFRFFMDHDKPVWDVGDIQIWKDSTQDDQDNINVQRYVVPPQGLDTDLTSRWQKLSGRQYPYNGVARFEDNLMMINAVVAPQDTESAPSTVLYTAFYGIGSTRPQDFMHEKLGLLQKDMRVLEH